MDLNKLYKEIEEAEVDLNAKRLKYIKEALLENGGSVKLKFKEFKEFKETNNAFDFDDQFPVVIEIDGISMYLTKVYVKKNDFRVVMLDYIDMTLYDYRDDEAWIIGGKNRYCGRENYGTMIKRYNPIGFNVGYREWAEQPE